MAGPLEKLSSSKVFEGELIKYKFKSAALGGLDTQFNLFIPLLKNGAKAPLLVYLAGLTCTEDNGAQKGGFFGAAAAQAISIIFPDTSPRGAGAPGEDDAWDFGTGAGFYLDATKPEYSKHYNMYTHITSELPEVIKAAGLPIVCHSPLFGLYQGVRKSLLTGSRPAIHLRP
ncbi:hypothetical protein EST38_g3257 [Candolleomyces aberdarensis]|uniref:S-formylglutathione hydrolase n=1 Tax=Candolleomyces aberdarensis TaxID=2316362 RepID=A0A4V1Q4M0_9AGAR|nr:hypothetical protein EST38_g3257 [Candolleomyces aberdarensis]